MPSGSRETVLSNAQPGEKALVVVHKALIGHDLFPEAGDGLVYADVEGRLLAFTHWGSGIGSNK